MTTRNCRCYHCRKKRECRWCDQCRRYVCGWKDCPGSPCPAEAAEDRIRKRLKKLIRDSDQFIVDVEWWNNTRTEHPPFDCEPSKLTLHWARGALDALNRGDRKAMNQFIDNLTGQSE